MDSSPFEVIRVNMVLLGIDLLNTPEQQRQFQFSIDDELTTIVTGGSRNHIINKHRISLDLSSERSIVQRDYLSSDEDLAQLVDVATKAMSYTDDLESQPLTAIGFNMEVVYTPAQVNEVRSPAGLYIASRIFPKRESFKDWELSGGGCKMYYTGDDRNRKFIVTIEPRLQDLETPKIFISTNVHLDTDEIRDHLDLNSRFAEVWKNTFDFIDCFDQWK